MVLNHLMEGESLFTRNVISPITTNINEKDHGTIKALIKNFILTDTNKMAIKDHRHISNNYAYTIPVKMPPSPINSRMKTINEAKMAFLNSTVTSATAGPKKSTNKDGSDIYYAQIAITSESDDTRSTGGGNNTKKSTDKFANDNSTVNSAANHRKIIEQQQQRKVSFKIKNASNSYRRPPLATKTTMTITSTKVSELTKKFNTLVAESHNGHVKQSKLAKTIEDLQYASLCSASNSSTPSSTLSSSPNIKIVLRQKRGSKRRNHKKRCSSMDSIDKLIITDNSSAKVRVIRSKSDGMKIPRSPKKRLKHHDLGDHLSGSDSVDGNPMKLEQKKETSFLCSENNVVKNAIKKFECEIIAQSNSNNALKKENDKPKSIIPVREKPKVPEKKSSLVLTKNVVVKDGVPKIKTIKPTITEPFPCKVKSSDIETMKKEPIYGKKKYKTNYIHTEKLPLQIVEIIQEELNDDKTKINDNNLSSPTVPPPKESKIYQDIDPIITPNDSFLWRRKSSTQIYSDSEKSISDSPYSFTSVTSSEVTITKIYDVENQKNESQQEIKYDLNSDFESNLVEAFNKSVCVEPNSEQEQNYEDDYEPLEPRDIEHVVIIPIKTSDRASKINCPLPEIPKENVDESHEEKQPTENIYQCLLEMRSHPEGDESSLHNYELCEEQLEERTRGDGDSDDGYEYCKSPIKPYCLTSSTGIQIAENYQPFPPDNNKNYAITKSVSGTSTISYEKIGSERIYEKIQARTPKSKDSSPNYSRHSIVSSDYAGYNDSENIYDTIKHGDGASLSHCYESIPNSPSTVKLRTNLKKQLLSAVHKRLSFDTVSNVSQSTLSSEQKTNSIYGQRSVISYNGQEIAFPVPNSDTSVSDRSDRSDDWVDVSDEEKNQDQKIVIVRERSRGRKSPVSWSQKVRHQWHKTPQPKIENQDCDSSESGHLYESLEPAPAQPMPLPIDDDFDSFDSDSDIEDHDASTEAPPLPATRLPSPPSGGQYTLTKIASAAHRKMRQIKRNLTKRYSVAMDGKPFSKLSQSNGTSETPKTKPKSPTPIYANYERPEIQHPYTNVAFGEKRPVLPVNKTENPATKIYGFKEELKTVIGEKRSSFGDVPPPLPDKPPPEKPTTPTEVKKDSGTLSRKAYFSFKSRFRRATSMAIDINEEVPSALKITNSTFYLTDSMDGDSGFSNCSDSGQAGSTETLAGAARRAELKRLLPTLSRKEKSPRTRTSWYAECGADDISIATSNTSWYAEAGLSPAGHVSTSSGASSGSHPASPLPHSLFTHEPLYQFYNAAKVESVCRESGDSDSETYERPRESEREDGSSPPAARPSAMALVAPRGPARTLWCEVPEVLSSAVLSSLAPAQKRLQEAKFELLTSEASYLNSLNVLEANFAAHPAFRDTHVLPAEDWDTLFSTILPVRKCSQLLMNELEKCWQENILLQGICDIVRRHAERHAAAYVRYCENQALMVKALQQLRERPAFVDALKRMESHPACQSLSLHSFLMLPMQRVTRLPLLLDAVLRHLPADDSEYQPCVCALATLHHLVQACNEGARNTERIEEMWRLSRVVQFPPSVKNAPVLGPACGRRDRRPVRWLVRSGELTQLVWKTDELKLTFGKKFHKIPLYLFLFNDLLVITKKKR
ncbi:hypothetical protein ACJJTC_008395 [Scirpophaga incertulas]